MAPVEFAGGGSGLVDLNTEPLWPVGFEGDLAIADLGFLCSGIDDLAATPILFQTLMFGAVDEGAGGAAFADGGGHVEAGPAEAAACTGSEVAVVIVAKAADAGDGVDGMGALAD